MNKGAVISDDKKYRYQLWREWDGNAPKVAIVGLNPSIADHEIDDPTILRCIDFAKSWGYGGFYIVNLFGFRATDPNELNSQNDPIGVDNDKHLLEVFAKVDKVVCAWGNGGTLMGRNADVLKMIATPYCIQKNTSGEPAHPLYLKKSLQPVLLFEETGKFNTLKKLLAEREANKNPFDPELSKYIFQTHRPSRNQIRYDHRLRHFGDDEPLLLSLKISDGQVIFNQSDEIIVGEETVYWYISRVGEFYTKSNGEFDAEHIGEEFVIKVAEIKSWKAILQGDVCYLELETSNSDRYSSVHVPIAEQATIFDLQKHLNQWTKASR